MPRLVPGLADLENNLLTFSICSRAKMNKKGTETGGNNEEEGEEEGDEEERIGGKERVSERDRRRITALTAHTRPWLDPHYGK